MLRRYRRGRTAPQKGSAEPDRRSATPRPPSRRTPPRRRRRYARTVLPPKLPHPSGYRLQERARPQQNGPAGSDPLGQTVPARQLHRHTSGAPLPFVAATDGMVGPFPSHLSEVLLVSPEQDAEFPCLPESSHRLPGLDVVAITPQSTGSDGTPPLRLVPGGPPFRPRLVLAAKPGDVAPPLAASHAGRPACA